jgi:hypothetical protein
MDKQKTIKDSKAEYGTMTAKFDANNDYSKSQTSSGMTSSTSGMTSSTTSKKSSGTNHTLTARKDANEDYTS